jgi:hypothetical protein
MTMDPIQPVESPARMLAPPPPPTSSAGTGVSSSAMRGDYLASAQMVNDILSLGSEDGPPAPRPATRAAPRAVAGTVVGPRPVPEAPLPPPPPPGPLSPDFFTSSKPKKRHRWGR